jgi:hypothetical protein
MSPNIAAVFYALLGIAIPFIALPRLIERAFLFRCWATWSAIAFLLFFVDNYLFILALAGVLLAAFSPSDAVRRVAFFIVIVPALPVYLATHLPFPGINWLIVLSYYKVVVLVVLLPSLLRLAPQREMQSIIPADVCIAAYIILTTVWVVAATGDLAAGGRLLIDQFLLLGVPYLALSRAIRSSANLEICFRAILLVCLILAAIALLATLKQWDFYRLRAPPSVFTIPDMRSGFIRIEATANTHSLGYHLALGILVLEYLKHRIGVGFVRLWGMRCAMFAALFFTDSRGAQLGLIIALAIFWVVTLKSSFLRRASMIGMLTVGVVGAVWLLSGDVSSVDIHGSTNYRRMLLSISIEHILEHPLLGDMGYLRHPRFLPLLQGQGIIDITNLYLQIGLAFGLLVMALFFAPVLFVLRRLLRIVTQVSSLWDGECRDLRDAAAIVLAAIVGWLALITTTSDVGLTVHLGVTFLALGGAILRFGGTGRSLTPTNVVYSR